MPIISNNDKRIFALLDVDGTLINNVDNENPVNLNLINALKNLGVTDVYLFTSMAGNTVVQDLLNVLAKTRFELVEMLAENHFTVHGVITPADPAYDKGLGEAYKDFYLPIYNGTLEYAKDKGKAINYDNVLELLTEIEINHPQFKTLDALKNYFSQLNCETGNNLYNTLKIKEGQQGPDSKWAMYSYFIDKKPECVGSVIYFDDSPSAIAAVLQANISLNKPVPLTIVKVIFNQQKQTEKYYSDAMKSHQKLQQGAQLIPEQQADKSQKGADKKIETTKIQSTPERCREDNNLYYQQSEQLNNLLQSLSSWRDKLIQAITGEISRLTRQPSNNHNLKSYIEVLETLNNVYEAKQAYEQSFEGNREKHKANYESTIQALKSVANKFSGQSDAKHIKLMNLIITLTGALLLGLSVAAALLSHGTIAPLSSIGDVGITHCTVIGAVGLSATLFGVTLSYTGRSKGLHKKMTDLSDKLVAEIPNLSSNIVPRHY